MNHIKRGMLFVLPFVAFLFASNAHAQGYYRFLGDPQQVPDQTSKRNGITYNTQGFDKPTEHRTQKMVKKNAPQSAIDAVDNFPGDPDAFSNWVDDAFEQTRKEFTACGGTLAQRGSQVPAKGVSITIEPTGFYVPQLGYAVAGAYFPSNHEIHVLNIYYIWSGPDNGWLRQSSDLLKWEMENYFGTEVGIQAEPRTPNWPCDAPRP